MEYTPKDKESRSSSVGVILKEIAENSSIHGIPKVISSKHLYLKALWLLSLTATCGYLIYQLQELFKTYYSYPIKTTNSLKFGILLFPAVSFCNMNPVKFSSVESTSKSVKNLLTQGGSDDETLIKTTPMNKLTGGKTILSKAAHIYGTNFLNSTLEKYWREDNDSKFIKYIKQEDQGLKDEWQERITEFKRAFQNESRKTRLNVGHQINDMLISCVFNGRICFAQNFTPFQSLDYGNCYTLQQPSFQTRKTGPLQDTCTWWRSVFIGGRVSPFTMYLGRDHRASVSKLSHMTSGLRLTLNIEKKEYVKDFLDAYGIRLVIHEPGSFSFPMEEGVTVSAGYETAIGMRMVKVNRIGKPHGDCENGTDFEKMFGIRYTIQSCIKLCKQRYVVQNCSCQPSESLVDIGQESLFDTLPACGLTLDSGICEKFIDYQLENRVIDCNCRNPCSQTVYQKSLSGRIWPKDEFLKTELLQELCSKNLSYTKTDCTAFTTDKESYDPSHYRDNFLKVIIYYEDLNYEVKEEDPMYDGFQFVSDIGGAMGLFMGASILSLVEVIHVFVEILNVVRRRIAMRRTLTEVEVLK